jgi:hypothetical protein
VTGERDVRASEPRSPGKRPAFESPGDLARPMPHDPGMRRPNPTIVGAVLVVLRVLAGAAWLVALVASWDNQVTALLGEAGLDPDELREGSTTVLWFVIVAGSVILLVILVLAYFIFRGSNRARIVVMVFATLSITAAFIDWWRGDQEITIRTTLLTLALDILLMLALSSRPARAYARRKDRSA